jgi:hypothetical protein
MTGWMQEARSNSMNSSTFSCGVSGSSSHSSGKTGRVPVRGSSALVTWKSLNSTRPH